MRIWLKELRNQRKLTQDQVAKVSGIERSYYTMIEMGSRNPSVSVAKAIGSTMGFEWTIFFESICNEMKQCNSKEVI